jgi:phosphoribosylanthranilate isomerase
MQSRSGSPALIKICGITSPEDASIAGEAGADLIGMIMWQKAKRGVDDATAKAIATAAKQHSSIPVGVFVDESAEVINRRCLDAGILVAQLHGDGARASLEGIDARLGVVWVMHSTPEGEIVTPAPPFWKGDGERAVDWVLIDGLQGGSGQALDWNKLSSQVPAMAQLTGGVKGWLLAGGLKPENVKEAVNKAHPTGVDVSSGVCGPDGLKKDVSKIVGFVQAVKEAK